MNFPVRVSLRNPGKDKGRNFRGPSSTPQWDTRGGRIGTGTVWVDPGDSGNRPQ